MKTLKTNFKNSIFHCELNRTDVRNAMNAEMIGELYQIFSSIDKNCRALVLSGAGNFFCAGGDLNWMKSSKEKSVQENEEDTLKLAKMLRALDECPVPVICLVKGGAFGGGVGLVACSDIVIADELALFSLSEVRLGLIPATIGPFVMRKIGMSQARRLYTTGHRFSASLAKDIGLVHETVSSSNFDGPLQEYLNDLSMSGPLAVKKAKALVRELMSGSLWDSDISEKTSKLLSEVRVGDEAQEGMLAFFEKRKASWVRELKAE